MNITYKHFDDTGRSEFRHVVEPSTNIHKRFTVGDVVTNENAVRATIIALSDSTKAFLTARIPDLKLKTKYKLIRKNANYNSASYK